MTDLTERLRTTRLLSQRNQLALQEEAATTLENLTQENARLREALESVRGISDDYQTSEAHHPHHVLIPLAKFEQLEAAEAFCAALDVTTAITGRSA